MGFGKLFKVWEKSLNNSEFEFLNHIWVQPERSITACWGDVLEYIYENQEFSESSISEKFNESSNYLIVTDSKNKEFLPLVQRNKEFVPLINRITELKTLKFSVFIQTSSLVKSGRSIALSRHNILDFLSKELKIDKEGKEFISLYLKAFDNLNLVEILKNYKSNKFNKWTTDESSLRGMFIGDDDLNLQVSFEIAKCKILSIAEIKELKKIYRSE